MKKPIISIKLSARNYSGLADLGNRLIASLTGNGNFTTPAVPLATLQAAVTDVETAIATWGNGQGTTADLADLRQNAVVLLQLINSEGHYVQLTAQQAAGQDFDTLKTILTTSGFDLANTGAPQGLLQKVQNFHRAVSAQLYPNQVKLMWRKPLNVSSAGNVKDYHIYRGTTAVFTDAEQVGETTRTSFVDTNITAAAVTWTYWVIPVNSAGAGVPSDPITVSIVSN